MIEDDTIVDVKTLIFPPNTRLNVMANMRGIIPLATPKTQKVEICCLCPRPARFICIHCRYIHYCSREHLDKDTIHPLMCMRLAYIYRDLPFEPCQARRVRQEFQVKNNKITVAHMLQDMAHEFLLRGNNLQCKIACKYSVQVFTEALGNKHEDTIEALLLLTSVCIKMGQFSEAETYLDNMGAGMSEHSDHSLAVKAELYKYRGLMEVAKGDGEAALHNFVEEVYMAVHAHGTHHAMVAGSYWRLGRAFLSIKQIENADSLYRQSTEIWLSLLQEKISECESTEWKKGAGSHVFTSPKGETLTLRLRTDGAEMLPAIYKSRKEGYIPSHWKDLTKAGCALAMFKFLFDHYSEAFELTLAILNKCVRHEDPALTSSYVSFYKLCRRKVSKEVLQGRGVIIDWLI